MSEKMNNFNTDKLRRKGALNRGVAAVAQKNSQFVKVAGVGARVALDKNGNAKKRLNFNELFSQFSTSKTNS